MHREVSRLERNCNELSREKEAMCYQLSRIREQVQHTEDLLHAEKVSRQELQADYDIACRELQQVKEDFERSQRVAQERQKELDDIRQRLETAKSELREAVTCRKLLEEERQGLEIQLEALQQSTEHQAVAINDLRGTVQQLRLEKGKVCAVEDQLVVAQAEEARAKRRHQELYVEFESSQDELYRAREHVAVLEKKLTRCEESLELQNKRVEEECHRWEEQARSFRESSAQELQKQLAVVERNHHRDIDTLKNNHLLEIERLQAELKSAQVFRAQSEKSLEERLERLQGEYEARLEDAEVTHRAVLLELRKQSSPSRVNSFTTTDAHNHEEMEGQIMAYQERVRALEQALHLQASRWSTRDSSPSEVAQGRDLRGGTDDEPRRGLSCLSTLLDRGDKYFTGSSESSFGRNLDEGGLDRDESLLSDLEELRRVVIERNRMLSAFQTVVLTAARHPDASPPSKGFLLKEFSEEELCLLDCEGRSLRSVARLLEDTFLEYASATSLERASDPQFREENLHSVQSSVSGVSAQVSSSEVRPPWSKVWIGDVFTHSHNHSSWSDTSSAPRLDMTLTSEFRSQLGEDRGRMDAVLLRLVENSDEEEQNLRSSLQTHGTASSYKSGTSKGRLELVVQWVRETEAILDLYNILVEDLEENRMRLTASEKEPIRKCLQAFRSLVLSSSGTKLPPVTEQPLRQSVLSSQSSVGLSELRLQLGHFQGLTSEYRRVASDISQEKSLLEEKVRKLKKKLRAMVRERHSSKEKHPPSVRHQEKYGTGNEDTSRAQERQSLETSQDCVSFRNHSFGRGRSPWSSNPSSSSFSNC